MSTRTIGTCSLCGGAVTVPDPWMGVTPPTPQCSRCHAVPVESHGPVIPMHKPRGRIYDFIVWQSEDAHQMAGIQRWRKNDS